MSFPLCVRILFLSLFVMEYFVSFFSFAVILKRNRELVALLSLFYGCFVTVNVL